ncbi:MAG: MBL fold metallo-hydrolase [Patescibacteria group bacterium]|nr:MBL fold metallo-hydrolase [Patescibacteria group bacterium]
MNYGDVAITKLKHASFLINFENQNIYIDPFRIDDNSPKADYVFITHSHFDHFSLDDLKKIVSKETKIISVSSVVEEIRKWARLNDLIVKPENDYSFEGLNFKTLPAYNTNKFKSPEEVFHPRSEQSVGYVIRLDKVSIYHTGDTDFIEEMKFLREEGVDVALVPVSGIYVMTPEEAASAVNYFLPKIAIPMHYGEIIGSFEDAKKFKELSKVEVVFN